MVEPEPVIEPEPTQEVEVSPALALQETEPTTAEEPVVDNDQDNTENVKASNLVYVTYSDTKYFTDSKLDEYKMNIKKIMTNAFVELAGLNKSESIKVYRVRFGPETTSVEVSLELTPEETITEVDIKKLLLESIKSGKIKDDLYIEELGLLKDIQIEDISSIEDISELPSQYKRVMVEMPGNAPETDEQKGDFERNTVLMIKEFLEEPSMNQNRIQIEIVAIPPTNINDRVRIQFLIMHDSSDEKTPNEIIMKLKENYGNGQTEYAKRYQISNIIFGDPAIIVDGTEQADSNTLEVERALVEEAEANTKVSLMGEYTPLKYHGCEISITDLKNNMIRWDTPLSDECNQTLEDYLR